MSNGNRGRVDSRRAAKTALAGAVIALAAGYAPDAMAVPIHMLFESNVDRAGVTEIFLGTFNSAAELLSGTLASGSFSQLDVNAAFSIADFTYDGSAYHVLFERNTDSAGGSEIFLGTFGSIADLLSGTLASGSFSQLDVNAAFSIGGFTYDGSAYRMIFERDTDSAGGSEVFLGTFSTIADLLSGNLASGSFSQLDVNAAFSIAGLNYDGSLYQMIFERDTDSAGGTEVFLGTFSTIADILSGNLASGSFSQLDVNAAFSIAGLASALPPKSDPDPVGVPEPSSLAMLLSSLALIGLAASRRKRRSLDA